MSREVVCLFFIRKVKHVHSQCQVLVNFCSGERFSDWLKSVVFATLKTGYLWNTLEKIRKFGMAMQWNDGCSFQANDEHLLRMTNKNPIVQEVCCLFVLSTMFVHFSDKNLIRKHKLAELH